MELNDNILKHSRTVAKRMSDFVMENRDAFTCSHEEMFVLGMLHDIGYAFTDDQPEHAKVAGEFLREEGYRYWREVYYHGIPQTEYDSVELRLLNYIDITTGYGGEIMSAEERIDEITAKYGVSSVQAKGAVELGRLVENNPVLK